MICGESLLLLYETNLKEIKQGKMGNYNQCEIIHEYCLEKLHSLPWNLIQIEWRQLYAQTCLFMAHLLIQAEKEYLTLKETYLKAMDLLDRGLLMGSPIDMTIFNNLIAFCKNQLFSLSHFQAEEKELIPNSALYEAIKEGEKMVDPKHQINRLSRPSLQEFGDNYLKKQLPVILTDCMEHWLAYSSVNTNLNANANENATEIENESEDGIESEMRHRKHEFRWNNLEYLMKKAGHRTVPIEIGSSYTNSNWTQKLIPFFGFFETICSRRASIY